MNNSNNISERLKQKGLDARSRFEAKLKKTPKVNIPVSLKKPILITALTGIATGIFWGGLDYAANATAESTSTQWALSNGGWKVMIFVILILITIFPILHWYALEFGQKWGKAKLLKGKTQGIVTRFNEGFGSSYYFPSFTVEYEVSGQIYSTNCKLCYGTEDESTVNTSERRYLGKIIPVRFDLNSPENAMAQPPIYFAVGVVFVILYLIVTFLVFVTITASFITVTILASVWFFNII